MPVLRGSHLAALPRTDVEDVAKRRFDHPAVADDQDCFATMVTEPVPPEKPPTHVRKCIRLSASDRIERHQQQKAAALAQKSHILVWAARLATTVYDQHDCCRSHVHAVVEGGSATHRRGPAGTAVSTGARHRAGVDCGSPGPGHRAGQPGCKRRRLVLAQPRQRLDQRLTPVKSGRFTRALAVSIRYRCILRFPFFTRR